MLQIFGLTTPLSPASKLTGAQRAAASQPKKK
jgi:hypothetical protein